MLLPLSSNAPGTLGYKIHVAYRGMLARCYAQKHPAFHNYGGRGISVCPEWQKSEVAFMQWALTSGVNIGLSLDRIDNHGNYEPTNCRWSTVTEQLNNQRRNRRISFNGIEKTLSQWAADLGLEFSALWRRLERGLPLEQALTAGKLRPWKHGTRAGYECHKCRCEACTANNTKRHQAQRAKRRSKGN